MPYARVPQILFWSAPLYFMSAQVHSFHEDPKCWLNHDQYFLCTSASKSPSLSIYLNIMRKIFPLLQAVNHDCFLYERPKISCYIYTRYTQQMCLMHLYSNVLNSRMYTVSKTNVKTCWADVVKSFVHVGNILYYVGASQSVKSSLTW